jgi:hypothetical protein
LKIEKGACRFSKLTAFGLFIYILGPGNTFGQTNKPAGSGQGSPEDKGSLVIGTAAGEPGTNVSVPIYYQPGRETSLRALHLEVEFTSKSVKFTRAEFFPLGKRDDVEETVKSRNLPVGEKELPRSQIVLDFSVAGGNTRGTLPEGLWALLDFSISQDAKPLTVSLNARSISAKDPSEKAVQLTIEKGEIVVSSADLPLAGCFFFTH